MQVIRNPDLGPKLTYFVTIMDLAARLADGEAQTPHGFRLPATTVAEKSGQKAATVRGHLKAAARAGWLQKTNLREPSTREDIDAETGEITSGTQDVTYIKVPEYDITLLIQPVASYRKQEPETRGGARTPRCPVHPEAPAITTHTTTCSECAVVLDRRVTVLEGGAGVQKTYPSTMWLGRHYCLQKTHPTPGAFPPPREYRDADAPHAHEWST